MASWYSTTSSTTSTSYANYYDAWYRNQYVKYIDTYGNVKYIDAYGNVSIGRWKPTKEEVAKNEAKKHHLPDELFEI